ncbi:hypothetical protein Mapa_017189 [Marchantia paleacea]|nr:hypothetical protein Mapa_017189 [Marchantia paleacea]
MLALSESFTRSVLDFSTSCTPGIARSGFPRSFCQLKLKTKKRPRLSLRPLVNASSCRWDGRGFLQLHERKSCHLDCRFLFSRRHDSHRTCSVYTRASALLAHGSRPAVKLPVDTSDSGLGPSVLKSDADVQQSVQSTVEAAQQIPEAEDDESVGEREKLRRQRIGLANKGKVPWNKGRQHSPETIERIRQKTYQAMHSPKVMAKLKLNPRHPQSDATRVKIRDKLREQWDLKKKIRGYQEACVKEWKACVAEVARVGSHGEEELQWNSYSVIKKRLREADRAAAKKPKRVAKPRPLKTEEHRQRISAAIRAKWEDPEYQQKVKNGMTKGGKVSAPRKKKPPASGTGVFEKKTSSEKAMDQSFIDAVMSSEKPRRLLRSDTEESDVEHTPMSPMVHAVRPTAQPIKKVNLLQKVALQSEPDEKFFLDSSKPVDEPTSSKPNLFVDPNASEKLKKLKLLQANRAVMEQRRRESAYHARILMAEAEKAANALEAAASKDEFAMASLTETRRLMAEAARLIKTAESGKGRLTGSSQSS